MPDQKPNRAYDAEGAISSHVAAVCTYSIKVDDFCAVAVRIWSASIASHDVIYDLLLMFFHSPRT